MFNKLISMMNKIKLSFKNNISYFYNILTTCRLAEKKHLTVIYQKKTIVFLKEIKYMYIPPAIAIWMTDVQNTTSIGTCTLVDFSEFHVICICTRHVRENILPLQLKHFMVMKHLLKKVSSFYNSFILICSDKWRLKRWEQGGINQGQFLKYKLMYYM